MVVVAEPTEAVLGVMVAVINARLVLFGPRVFMGCIVADVLTT